jgi:hypothetical protein
MFVLRILSTDNAAFSILRLLYSYAIEILSSCVLSDVVINLLDVSDLMISTRKLSLAYILLRCTKWVMKYSCRKAIVFGRLT